jgi:lipopolysaccharide export system protein LptA
MIKPFALIARCAILCATLLLGTDAALAQGTNLKFGGLKGDPSQPVEVKADSLSVDQTNGAAEFSGNVLVTQGAMKLSADKVTVTYAADQKQVQSLHATGNVLLVNATDAAKGNEAVYTIASGAVVMTGDVVLTQGAAAIKGQKLSVDLKSGTGRMEGGVTTTFVPGGN